MNGETYWQGSLLRSRPPAPSIELNVGGVEMVENLLGCETEVVHKSTGDTVCMTLGCPIVCICCDRQHGAQLMV